MTISKDARFARANLKAWLEEHLPEEYEVLETGTDDILIRVHDGPTYHDFWVWVTKALPSGYRPTYSKGRQV